MSICKCGRKTVGSGKQCRRCAALNELGLKAGASEASIKSAYRAQIKAWHPDRQGKNAARQLAAEENAKRINAAYKYLTSSSKRRGDFPDKSSAASPASPMRDTHGDRNQKKPEASGAARAKVSRRSRQSTPTYPQRDFIAWKAAFEKLPMGRTKAKVGMEKWIRHEAATRNSAIAYQLEFCKKLGVEPNLKGYAKPEDSRADVLNSLWSGSVPNVEERTRAIKSDKQFLESMEQLRNSVDKFASIIQARNAKLRTQDGGFTLTLDPVRESCIQLSTSIATASAFVKREYMQPLKLADCCIGLVWQLEEKHGLAQSESHELIKFALLAHGCTKDQVAPFDDGSVDRGTIRAKKEALVKKTLDSANVIALVMQDIKNQNGGS